MFIYFIYSIKEKNEKLQKEKEQEERDLREKNYLVSANKRSKQIRRETKEKLEFLHIRDEEMKKQKDLAIQLSLLEKENNRRLVHERYVHRSKSAGGRNSSFEEDGSRINSLSLVQSEAHLLKAISSEKAEKILSSKGYIPVDVRIKTQRAQRALSPALAAAVTEETYFELDEEDSERFGGDEEVWDSLEIPQKSKHRETLEYSKQMMMQRQQPPIEFPVVSHGEDLNLNGSFDSDGNLSGLTPEPEKFDSEESAARKGKKKDVNRNQKQAIPIWKKLEPIHVAPFAIAKNKSAAFTGR